MPFVSVVPLCSIYLWCNQNVFKRILQWTNTIYSGSFDISTTNCSLGIFAKSLDGLPRAWVRIPPTPPLWQSALGEIRELFCFVKLFLAKCYSGLPRTGFATPTHSANYGNRLSEKSESFFVFEFCFLRNVIAVYLAQGLPPQPTPPTMAIGSWRNPRAFLFLKSLHHRENFIDKHP